MSNKKDNFVNVAAAIIKNSKGEVLITRRAPGEKFPGKWEFPGGKIESGEKGEVCVAREIKEELGIDINVKEPFLVSTHDYNLFGVKSVRLYTYLCDITKGKVNLSVHDKHAWVHPEKMKEYDFVEADLKPVKKLVS